MCSLHKCFAEQYPWSSSSVSGVSCTTAAAGAVPCLLLPCPYLLLIPCLLQHEMNSPAKTGVGTPVYMAPEVILGDNKYDAKVSC